MSIICWAGVGIDPETQSAEVIEEVNAGIDGMICELDVDTRPVVRITGPDGSERRRYLFGRSMVTDILDRAGVRVGFGIEACSEQDANAHVAEMQTLLNRWDVDAWVSVWAWSPLSSPKDSPVETHA
jgi:hypothetical protein